jgi:hypothetical protein
MDLVVGVAEEVAVDIAMRVHYHLNSSSTVLKV